MNGNITNEYVFFAGRRISRIDASGNVFFYYADHLGTARTITNGTGTVCYDADFTPYGQEMNHTNNCPQNYKFTGYERDSETGLDYAMFRYYNPRLGRFMSADPLAGSIDGPQSLHRYAYSLNDPINFFDPSGLCGEPDSWDPTTNTLTGYLPCSDDSPTSAIGGMFGGGFSEPVGLPLTYRPGLTGGFGPTTMRATTWKDRLACAADYADQHSMASGIGGGKSFLPNLFLGNAAAGIVHFGFDVFGNRTPTGQEVAIGLLSGAGQGIPGGGPGMQGPAGMLQDATVGRVATQVVGEGAAETAANLVGLAKLGYDVSSLVNGYIKCK